MECVARARRIAIAFLVATMVVSRTGSMKTMKRLPLVLLIALGVIVALAIPIHALSPDTDLSHADAAFWGEDGLDYSGYSVASAGDVNGDGYDDILIGAHFDGDGGAKAGQTYLILGKASGWAMDTDLSNADASFIGEGGNNASGYSVASAGDVNGDGGADILIGAYNNHDGGIQAGQTYLLFGTPPPPPVGGEVYPVNKLGLITPWVIVVALIVVAGVWLGIWNRRRATVSLSDR